MYVCIPFLLSYLCFDHALTFFIDHPRSGVVYTFGHVYMYVCLYVCQTITFESFDVGSSYLQMRHYLQTLRVRFAYQSHRIKVKVTGAKKVENSYSRNVKLRYNRSIKHRAVTFACSMGFRVRRIEWCDRHLCHVTGSEHA